MNFETLGLKPRLVKQLKAQGITEPTPIQMKAIPHAMAGRDVMGLAQTGTGKTAAFGLPLLDKLFEGQELSCEPLLALLQEAKGGTDDLAGTPVPSGPHLTRDERLKVVAE